VEAVAPSAVIRGQVLVTGLVTDVGPPGQLARAVDQRAACVAGADRCEYATALRMLAGLRDG
jgi:hypothetical protein